MTNEGIYDFTSELAIALYSSTNLTWENSDNK